MRKSMSKKKSQFRRKFFFVISLFFVLLIFLLGVEVGQRFSGVSLRGQKKGSEKHLLAGHEKSSAGITEAVDEPSEEDTPDTKITFYDALQDEGKEGNTAVAHPPAGNGHITAREEVKRENAPPPGEDVRITAQPSKYALQLGSYKSRSQAEEMQSELKKKGYQAYILEASIPEKGTWYRVKVGDYEDLEEVRQAASDLKQKEGVSVMITKVSR
jgi:cell division septation protein DedD